MQVHSSQRRRRVEPRWDQAFPLVWERKTIWEVLFGSPEVSDRAKDVQILCRMKRNRESSYPTSAQRHDSYRVSDRTTAIDSRVTGNPSTSNLTYGRAPVSLSGIKTRSCVGRTRARPRGVCAAPIRARRGAPAVTLRLRDRRFHFRRSKRFHTVRPLCVHGMVRCTSFRLRFKVDESFPHSVSGPARARVEARGPIEGR